MLPGPVASGGAIIPAEQVTQLKFKHPLYRYDGYSPLTAGAEQMDILEMIDRSRWSAFQRGVNTNLVLEVDPVKGATVKQEDLNNLKARLTPWASFQPVLFSAPPAASIIILIARRIGSGRFGHRAATLSKSSHVLGS
jgi:hypothetical protein